MTTTFPCWKCGIDVRDIPATDLLARPSVSTSSGREYAHRVCPPSRVAGLAVEPHRVEPPPPPVQAVVYSYDSRTEPPPPAPTDLCEDCDCPLSAHQGAKGECSYCACKVFVPMGPKS